LRSALSPQSPADEIFVLLMFFFRSISFPVYFSSAKFAGFSPAFHSTSFFDFLWLVVAIVSLQMSGLRV